MSISGKTLCFTGALEIKRADAKKQAEAAGAKVTGSVSKNTDILVAGPGAGSKIAAAEAKGVEVWDEAQFVAAVSGGGGKKRKAAPKAAAKKAPAAKRAKSATKKSASTMAGKKFVLTGTLATLKRTDAKAQIEAAGGKVVGAVSKNVDICVCAPGAGAKQDKAESLGLEIWDEDELVAALGGGSAPTKKATAKKAKAKAEPEEEEEEEEEKAPAPKKKKSAPKKAASKKAAAAKSESGGRTVDREVPGKDSYSIYQEYAIKLNQTNIGGNNNKFYIINLLANSGSYAVWTRWGRVGEPGQNKMDSNGANLEAAIKGFKKKFKDKTKNNWDDLPAFTKVEGKYQLVQTEESGDGDDDAPLGRLTKDQIEAGQAVLAEIDTAITKKAKSKYNELSSQFFSLIPTNFGRKRPEPITTIEVLRAKEELLKFYLRMGFEDMEEDKGLTPIAGVMDLPLPDNLKAAAAALCGASDITRCQSKGKELATKQAGGPSKKMGLDLYAAILLYTSNAIYSQLNKALRDENRAAVKKYFKYLRLLLEAFDFLPKNKTKLWRGISCDLFDQYKVGSEITWWSVSSCTADEQVARNFMRGCGGKCTLITVEAKSACDISQVTFYSNEKESLLAPGTKFKVKSSKRVGNVAEIVMEEIGCCLK